MYMFSIVSLFAAFTAMANAAAIPVTPTPTQAGCVNEQSAIAHVHDLTEQIESKLVAMQSEEQMPDNNLVEPINDARNLARTILAMTKASNGGAVVSISPTHVVRKDESGLARLIRKAVDVSDPIQTCSYEKAVLAQVQDLAELLREKLIVMQDHGGSSSGLLNDVLHLIGTVLSFVDELLGLVLGGVVGGITGGPFSAGGVATGVAGGVAEGAIGNVAGGVAGGVLGTGTGAASGIAGGVLGVISGSGGAAGSVDGCYC